MEHADVEEDWTALRTMLHSTTLESLGVPPRKHQDWFDENNAEIQALLDEKHCLYKAYLKDSSSSAKKSAFLNMQETRLCPRAEEIQSYADRNNTKCFYDALKQVYGPQSSGTSPLLSADETTLLINKDKILERWAERFNAVPDQPSSMDEEAIARLPQNKPCPCCSTFPWGNRESHTPPLI